MPEPTESLPDLSGQTPSDIAGITDDVVEREDAEQATANAEDSNTGAALGLDLSWCDKENVRDTLSQVLAGHENGQTIVDGLRDGYERKDAFTRKTQALARERKELEKLAEAGKHWESLIADDGMMQHLLAYQKGGGPTEPELSELPKDIFEAEPRQIADYAVRQLEAKYAPMMRELEQIKASIADQRAPTEHINTLDSAMGAWAEDNGATQEVMQKVGKVLMGEYDLSVFTPQSLQAMLPRLVHSVTAEEQLAAAKDQRQHESRQISKARTASPQGGTGGASPVEVSFNERVRAKQEKLGRPLRTDEASSMAFQDFLNDLQQSEDNLDRGLRDQGIL